MFKCLRIFLLFLVLAGFVRVADLPAGQDLELGRLATPEEIAAWDIDIRPDGTGLPVGSGNASAGEEIYMERCAFCHGEFGEGAGRFPVLMGGEDTLKSEDPVKTLGSYWPYTTTIYDYVYRAMPFGEAQSLSPDEVYALTAFLLFLNDVIDEETELNQDNLAVIELPNRIGFSEDPRPDTFVGEPCRENCKEEVKITSKAKPLAVTPEGDDDSQ
jgi:cytochrome c